MKKQKSLKNYRILSQNGTIYIQTIKKKVPKKSVDQETLQKNKELIEKKLLVATQNILPYYPEDHGLGTPLRITNEEFLELCEKTIIEGESNRHYIDGLSLEEYLATVKTVNKSIEYLTKTIEYLKKNRKNLSPDEVVKLRASEEALLKARATRRGIEKLHKLAQEDISRYEIINSGSTGEVIAETKLKEISQTHQTDWIFITNVSLPFNMKKKKNNRKSGKFTPSYEFDFIIISNSGIYNLEVKNYKGEVKVHKDGIFTRHGVSLERNPVVQVQKHVSYLQKLMTQSNEASIDIYKDIKGAILLPNATVVKNESCCPVFSLDEEDKIREFLQTSGTAVLSKKTKQHLNSVINNYVIESGKASDIEYHQINKEYLMTKFYPRIKSYENYNKAYRNSIKK